MAIRKQSDEPVSAQKISLRRKILYTLPILCVALLVAEIAVRPFVPLDIVGPSAVRFDPYYGKHLKENYSGTLTARGNSYRITTNSRGFRGPEYIPSEYGSLLCFGDSFGMGSTVDDGEEFAAILNARFSDVFGEGIIPVVNTSVAGNGQGRWLKFLRRDAEQYNPRYVVMQLCNNDFCDNHAERLFKIGEDNELVELPIRSPSIYRRTQEIVESVPLLPYSRLYSVFKQAVKHTLTNEGTERAEREEDCASYYESETGPFDDFTVRLLEECLMLCAENGWPVVAVTANIPMGSRLDRLLELFERFDATLIHIPTIGDRPELFNTGGDTHWNAVGHLYVADRIFDHLIQDAAFVPVPTISGR